MAELPSVIPSALIHIHVINTLERDDTHQYNWKISRNSENVSLFVKCILPAKSVTRDKVVPGSFPVKPAGKKSRKKKTPCALRRSAKRLKRFQEKKAAEQAILPKRPAKEVVSAVRKEQETITVSSKDSCKDLESSDQSSIERSTCVKQGLKHLESQASENLSLAEEQAILLEVLEEAGIDSDDDLEDAGPDSLSAWVLKECSSEIAPILALIYNETLAQGTVPDDWRQANVAPIFKKGEKYDAANYRPVSLT